MAKYIKQELPDLHKTGEKKAYFRLKTERKIDFHQFIDRISSHYSGISRGEAIHVLMFTEQSSLYCLNCCPPDSLVSGQGFAPEVPPHGL